MLERAQERPNPNPSNSFETLSLSGEVVFSKDLTLEELPGFTKYETYRIGLDTVPFTFEVRDLGDFFLNIASFSEKHPLNSRSFLDLLSAAKSGGSFRTGQDIDGITADWDIILPEVKARNPRKKELYDHHKKYVPHFSEFEENHFKKFWDAINAPSIHDLKKEEDNFFNRQVWRFISEEYLTLRYGEEFLTNDLRRLLRMHWMEKYRDLATEFLKKTRYCSFVDLKDRSVEFIERRHSLSDRPLTKAEWEQLWAEWNGYVASRTGDTHRIDASNRLIDSDESIILDKNGNLYDEHMVSESSSEYRLSEPALNGADSIEKFGSGQIKVSKGESYIMIDFVADEKGIRMPVIKEKRYGSNPPSYVSPLIIWQRNKETDKASYFCGQIPQEFIQSHPHLFSQRHDTLLGQLVVSAYSSKVRDQMSKSITMRGTNDRKVTQQLLEAQSVLLVPGHDQVFLEQSPVILGLEKLRAVDRA